MIIPIKHYFQLNTYLYFLMSVTNDQQYVGTYFLLIYVSVNILRDYLFIFLASTTLSLFSSSKIMDSSVLYYTKLWRYADE